MSYPHPVVEAEFHTAVRSWLLAAFEHVEHEVTLESGRRPDFIAHTPFESYVLEVESSGEKLYESIGQALVYAHETGYEPVVVFPASSPPDGPVPEEIRVVTL